MNSFRRLRDLRRAPLALAFLLTLAFAPGAHAYELVEVRSGSEIVVLDDGEQVILQLAGVWVPVPPEEESPGDYRGEDALRYVEEVLRTQQVVVREVGPRKPGERTVKVRIRFGPEGEYDLAVSLAAAGLALHSGGSAGDPQHLEAVYRGERGARQAQVGMHDGGYGQFKEDSVRTLLSLGEGVLAPTPADQFGGLLAFVVALGEAAPPPAPTGPAAKDLAEVIGEFWSPLWVPIGRTPDP